MTPRRAAVEAVLRLLEESRPGSLVVLPRARLRAAGGVLEAALLHHAVPLGVDLPEDPETDHRQTSLRLHLSRSYTQDRG